MDAGFTTMAFFNAAGMSALPQAALTTPPAPADIRKFEEAMTQSVVPPVMTDAPVVESAVKAVPNNVGDAILGTFERLSTNWQAGVDKVTEHLQVDAENPMSFQGMMSLQLDLVMLSMQSDLTAKVADRVSQGLQTLFRNQ